METSLLMCLFIHKYRDPAVSLVLLSRLGIHRELDKAYLHGASVQQRRLQINHCTLEGCSFRWCGRQCVSELSMEGGHEPGEYSGNNCSRQRA